MYACVSVCVRTCVCEGFVSRFARVVCRGFYTVVALPWRMPRAEKKKHRKEKIVEKREQGKGNRERGKISF